MIDRALGFGPVQAESYYFQLIPLALKIVSKEAELPAAGTTYRFLIQKGMQKFDENRVPVEAAFIKIKGETVMPITDCRLNFYIPSHNRQRKIEFILKLIQHEHNQDYELGNYTIDVNQLVQNFKETKNNRHEIKFNFSEDYELEFEIYVDTSRVGLEKNIREKKFDRASKSPLRNRKESEEPSSGRKNFVQENRREEKQPAKTESPSPAKQTPKPADDEKTEAKEEKKATQSVRSNPKPPSVVNRSEKNEKAETGSVQSKGHVPMVQTKYKPLSKPDTPGEIKMSESTRLAANGEPTEAVVHHGQQSYQEKVSIWLFLIIGTVLIYWVMHPTRRA